MWTARTSDFMLSLAAGVQALLLQVRVHPGACDTKWLSFGGRGDAKQWGWAVSHIRKPAAWACPVFL